MKFYVNILVATLLLLLSFSAKAESEYGGDFERFNQIAETSANNMGKCIEIVNKLEVLRAELVMLLKGINLSAAGVNDNKNPQTVKTIISNIKMICKLLQTAINDKTDNEEKAKEVAENMESADSKIIEKYESVTKILVGLHDKIYKTILKFNLLHTEIEDLMSNITHDLRNINMPLNVKEEKTKNLKEKLKELKAEVKTMLPELDKSIDKCKEHIEKIEQMSKEGKEKNKKEGKQKNDDTGKKDKKEIKKKDNKDDSKEKNERDVTVDQNRDNDQKKKDGNKEGKNEGKENDKEKQEKEQCVEENKNKETKSEQKKDKNAEEKTNEENENNETELKNDSDSKEKNGKNDGENDKDVKDSNLDKDETDKDKKKKTEEDKK